MANKKKPQAILDLHTTVEPTAFVRVDGELYPLVEWDSLSLTAQRFIVAKGQEVGKLADSDDDDFTQESAAQLEAATRELFDFITPDWPDDVRRRCAFGLQMQVIAAFIEARTNSLMEGESGPKKRSGGKSKQRA